MSNPNHSTTRSTLRIGCGRGPHEARRFVAMLATALGERLGARGVRVHNIERHGEPEAPGRVVLHVDTNDVLIDDFVGTHLLIAELRGNRARRRWFAAVEHDCGGPPQPTVLPRHELDIRFVRSRGPGGQNVNKRATAVQITHRPTAISVRCDSHRSQARNRATAMENLQQAVARHTVERDAERQKDTNWRDRRELLTRDPVMRWRLDTKAGDLIVPVAST